MHPGAPQSFILTPKIFIGGYCTLAALKQVLCRFPRISYFGLMTE